MSKEKEEKMKNKEEENNIEIIKLNDKTKNLEETIIDLEKKKKKYEEDLKKMKEN